MKIKNRLLAIIVSIIMVSLMLSLSACGKEESTAENKLSVSSSETVEEPVEEEKHDVPAGFKEGYEYGEFDKFNSPAKENGLGDTPVWIEGCIEEVYMLNQLYCATLSYSDDEKWQVLLDWEYGLNTYDDIEGHTVCIVGLYTGFAEVMKQPHVEANKLYDEDTGNFYTSSLYSVVHTDESTEETYEEISLSEDELEEMKTAAMDAYNAVLDSSSTAITEAVSAVSSIISGSSESGSSPSEEEEPVSTPAPAVDTPVPTAEPTPTPVLTPVSSETVEERNALSSAKSYLNYMAFSYSGLYDQLIFEGYSDSAATYAVDNCGADWYEQAAKCAASYLDYMSFSHSGLVDQLIFEGFTSAQAEYGASQTGL